MQETQETQAWSLGWEDPLEKEMATHSSIFALKIPRTEEPGGLRSTGSQRVGHDWAHSALQMAASRSLLLVSNSHLAFSSSWELPFRCSYQFMAPETSAPGKQILDVTLDLPFSPHFVMVVCPPTSVLQRVQEKSLIFSLFSFFLL